MLCPLNQKQNLTKKLQQKVLEKILTPKYSNLSLLCWENCWEPIPELFKANYVLAPEMKNGVFLDAKHF